MGKEFYNADVQRLVNMASIYSTYSVMKASDVERFNCTLKNDMWKMFTLNENYKWIDLSCVKLQCSKASNDRYAIR